MYGEVTGHENALFIAGILFVVSSILLVPAALGIVHLLRQRGVVLGHVGGAFALLGAAGHMGVGTYYLMLSRVPHAGTARRSSPISIARPWL